jgi:hypothetical protein
MHFFYSNIGREFVKKFVSFLLLIFIFIWVISMPLSSEATTHWKDLYKDHIIKTLKEMNVGNIVLSDLDFDGIPELFIGESGRMSSPVYDALTIRNGKIAKLKHEGDGLGGFDNDIEIELGFNTFTSLNYFMDGSKFIAFGQDESSSLDGSSFCYYELYLTGVNIKTTELACISSYVEYDENSKFIHETFTILGKKANPAAYTNYKRMTDDYFMKLMKIHVPHAHLPYISYSTSEINVNEIHRLIEKLYSIYNTQGIKVH